MSKSSYNTVQLVKEANSPKFMPDGAEDAIAAIENGNKTLLIIAEDAGPDVEQSIRAIHALNSYALKELWAALTNTQKAVA